MTSKEAYYILIQAWHGSKDNGDYPNFDDINEAFDTLKHALERLEVLEKSNNTLAKITGNQLATIHTLIEENEKLKNENKDLWENIETYNHKFAEVERKKCDLIQQNEKLKKAIEILKEKFALELKNSNLLFLYNYQYFELSQQEYELLKEVLGE